LFCGVHRLDLIQAPVAAGGVAVVIFSVMSTRYPRSGTVTINPGWRLIGAQVGSLLFQVGRLRPPEGEARPERFISLDAER
jgi:hypothetical protein